MGWKFDDDNKEWIPTEIWNQRSRDKTDLEFKIFIGLMSACCLTFIAILPARIIKWGLGDHLFPRDISFWQFFVDLCISIPIYLLIAGVVFLMLGKMYERQNSNDEKQNGK